MGLALPVIGICIVIGVIIHYIMKLDFPDFGDE